MSELVKKSPEYVTVEDGSGFRCRVILDSLAATPHAKRLTTLELTYPRFIHSEVLTHRDRARNSASSRAIPWNKMKANILDNPVVPIRWGSEQKGMKTGEEVSADDQTKATMVWLRVRNACLEGAQELHDLGIHKSLVNRLTEPFMWITVLMTATEWKNFFRLRCHEDAEIHFQRIAGMALEAMTLSKPKLLELNNWHLPLILEEEHGGWPIETLRKMSVARCARVSYVTHDGRRDPKSDIELYERLLHGSSFGHWSPFEHVAKCMLANVHSGPFRGWLQFRKTCDNECADTNE